MISTKGRYALRVMIDLAEQNSAGYIPLNEIATRQQISEKYLEIILKVLVKNKLLEGQRGKGGGYRLTRPINEYTAGEILELTEGSLSSVACLAPDAPPCERQTSCVTLPMWKRFDQVVHNFFFRRSGKGKSVFAEKYELAFINERRHSILTECLFIYRFFYLFQY